MLNNCSFLTIIVVSITLIDELLGVFMFLMDCTLRDGGNVVGKGFLTAK